MTPRMNIFLAAPDAVKGMMAVGASVEKPGLERRLLERASHALMISHADNVSSPIEDAAQVQ